MWSRLVCSIYNIPSVLACTVATLLPLFTIMEVMNRGKENIWENTQTFQTTLESWDCHYFLNSNRRLKWCSRCRWGQSFSSAAAHSPRGLLTYLTLLVAAPQTSITGVAKHVTEREWIWKGRVCGLGSGNLSTVVWSEPYSTHAAQRTAWRLLNTLQSRWTSFKVQRSRSLLSTNPQGVWGTEKGKFITHRHTYELYWIFLKKRRGEGYGFSGSAVAPGVCHPGLEEGLLFTDGTADVGGGAFCSGFLITWPGFSAFQRCGIWNTVFLHLAAGFINKNYIFPPRLSSNLKPRLLLMTKVCCCCFSNGNKSPNEDEPMWRYLSTSLRVFSSSSKVKDSSCESCFSNSWGRAATPPFAGWDLNHVASAGCSDSFIQHFSPVRAAAEEISLIAAITPKINLKYKKELLAVIETFFMLPCRIWSISAPRVS